MSRSATTSTGSCVRRDLGLETFVLDEVLLDRRMHAASLSHAAPNWDDFFAIAHSRIARNRR